MPAASASDEVRLPGASVLAATSGGTDQLDDEQQVCENCDEEHEDADVPTDDDSAASCSSDADGEDDRGAAFRGGAQGWFWDFGDYRPSHSRRSDASLTLNARAWWDLRRQLGGGGQTRLLHARRARGDG